jgi:hypothetical protein
VGVGVVERAAGASSDGVEDQAGKNGHIAFKKL